MAKAIEQLLVLQECDREIGRLRREMQDIPARQKQMESRLDAQKEGLSAAERKLLEAQSSIKQIEGEIEAAKQSIRKFKDQQLQIKSNDGYRALETQIAGAAAQIRALEDRELGSMEALEKAQGMVAEYRTALAKEKGRVDEEVAVFLERSAGLDGELKAKEAERAARAGEIDAQWLARYDRIFAKQRDTAISLVEHGTCGACHMRLSPAQVMDARKADSLTLCDFCGRMLYCAE